VNLGLSRTTFGIVFSFVLWLAGMFVRDPMP
jgi:hypothetical protein